MSCPSFLGTQAPISLELRTSGTGSNYQPLDMKVLYLTRKVALTRISASGYERIFGSSVEADFQEELEQLSRLEWIERRDGDIALTGKGCFFADTVAGTLALRATRLLRMLQHTKGKSHGLEEVFTSVHQLGHRRHPMG